MKATCQQKLSHQGERWVEREDERRRECIINSQGKVSEQKEKNVRDLRCQQSQFTPVIPLAHLLSHLKKISQTFTGCSPDCNTFFKLVGRKRQKTWPCQRTPYRDCCMHSDRIRLLVCHAYTE